jgi:hypothetical protein
VLKEVTYLQYKIIVSEAMNKATKSNRMKLFCAFFVATAFSFSCFSQNIEEIGIKKGIQVNGSVNLNTVG